MIGVFIDTPKHLVSLQTLTRSSVQSELDLRTTSDKISFYVKRDGLSSSLTTIPARLRKIRSEVVVFTEELE